VREQTRDHAAAIEACLAGAWGEAEEDAPIVHEALIVAGSASVVEGVDAVVVLLGLQKIDVDRIAWGRDAQSAGIGDHRCIREADELSGVGLFDRERMHYHMTACDEDRT